MNFHYTNAVIGFRRRVFAIAQFTFDVDIRAFLQCASPFR